MLKKISMLSLLPLAFAVHAQPDNTRIIVVPTCLALHMQAHKTLATNNSLSLIQTDDAGVQQLINAKAKPKKACGGFFDVTDDWKNTANPQSFLAGYAPKNTTTLSSLKEKKYKINYPDQVNALIAQNQPQTMWNNLITLSNFKDRYANSDNGVKAAEWFKTEMEMMAKEHNRTDVTAYFVQTGNRYKQPSLVVKVGDSNEAGVVVGAHMDTLDSSYENKPGADDDGTGSVTVLEAARSLFASNLHFKKPIYFVWYSAEEEGLIGSSYVVKDFKAKNIPVDAVFQVDMTGYTYPNDPAIWILKDNVDTDLTKYLKKLITAYVKQPIKETQCGYACSDHASWTRGGFKSSMAAETAFENTNHRAHSAEDTIDVLSLDHMNDYLKLTSAFIVELAEPVT